MFETSTPSITNAFSEPLAPLTEYPPTPPPGLFPDVPVAVPAALPALTSYITPGAAGRIELNVRPFGVFSMNFSVMLVAVLVEVKAIVSNSPAVTVTDSETWPAGSSRSTIVDLPSNTVTFSDLTVLKPCLETDTLYVPTGASGNW